jgi:hypothetical protein
MSSIKSRGDVFIDRGEVVLLMMRGKLKLRRVFDYGLIAKFGIGS